MGTTQLLAPGPAQHGAAPLAESITPGHHPTFQCLGLTFNTDTLLSTAVAGTIVLGLGLYMARRASAGRPSRLQLIFEILVEWVQAQVDEQMGVRAPRGVVQLCITTFAFILIANWLAILPTESVAPPPTSDVNLVYPMALLVFGWVNVVSIRRQGLRRHFGRLTEPYAFLAPNEFVIQYFGRPVSLALRLWGNIFAGGLMVMVIGQLPAYLLWLPTAGWKLFDMFVGLLQALIFTILTIIYFAEAVGENPH
ncbi:MAG TPA: F0F1 ATP synthase subunit A [Pseudonocardia sp.]|jgi:F-type H+-transporting ATPase subunit a|uniref:F0F1 ATP synthase subunit A n=1 Tax=Pseudonocardia sp. TaxID=60912 RepID=UPI002F409E56